MLELKRSFAFLLESDVPFLDGVELDTLAWKQRDNRFLAFSNNENVADSSGEGLSSGISDVHNVEAAWVFLNMLEDSHSTDVVSTSNHD